MSRRSKNPCGTKSTFTPWPSYDREMRLERPPESATGGGFAMLRIYEGIGTMPEGRGCLPARRRLMTAGVRTPCLPAPVGNQIRTY